MRKFIKHYGKQNTRHIIDVFSSAYLTSTYRIAGNLKTLEYDEQSRSKRFNTQPEDTFEYHGLPYQG